MALPALDNLVRIGQLKAEPRNESTIAELIALVAELIVDVTKLIDSPRP